MLRRFFSQSFFVPAPTITEKNCPDQTGRVFVVTGGYTGVGYELASLLYGRNASVYIAGRSQGKADAAMPAIKAAHPQSKGKLEFMLVDLADMTTIKPAVEAFLGKEQQLHVLVNNAGVMFPPKGTKDSHGTEVQIGTNCVGHWLLYTLLKPVLARTAAASPPGSVRVTWAGSLAVDLLSPKSGMDLGADGRPNDKGPQGNYGQSKAGNLFFAREGARSTPQDGVVHLCFNPGNLKTELQRHASSVEALVFGLMLHPAVYGGYTELWAAVSPDVTPERSGAFVHPWGRFGGYRDDIEKAMKTESEGGTGVAAKFVAWCDQQIAPYS